MGNISSLARASTALDSYVAELGNDISYEKSLSASRFLKTILVRHEYGLLVLKLFIKPDPLMTLRVYQRRLKNQRDILQGVPNVLSYSTFVETDKAGYLIRQWAGSSLYDRISTRPYLTSIEKKWIAFQILTALRDTHALDVPHGDLKSENILITPSLGVYVTDFASAFKPTYLPLNDPSDFSFFYDSSKRRTCYIAPERFYEEGSKVSESKKAAMSISLAEAGAGASNWLNSGVGKKDGKITEEMDCFSAGCVLVEMWTDGAGLFNLSELFAFREGEMGNIETVLGTISDENVRSMISLMLSLNPQHRPSFDRILEDYRNTVFPDYLYTFLPEYISSISTFASPSLTNNSSSNHANGNNPVARYTGQSDAIMQRIHSDWPGIITAVLDEHAMGAKGKVGGVEGDEDGIMTSRNDHDGPALLLLNIITANVRNCLRPSSRLSSFRPLEDLARRLSTEDLSDRIIPYLVSLTKDEVPQVRGTSCKLLTSLMRNVKDITASNLELVPEYIIPNIRHLAEDEDVFVRCAYAESLPVLAEVALHMLEMGEALRVGVGKAQDPFDDWKDPDYDVTSSELQSLIEEQAAALLVDSSSEVKRAALVNASKLCLLFGRQRTSDVLLSRMITYLNDQDWRLRQSFLQSIVSVAAFVGTTSLEEFVLPLMEQALADPEDSVSAKVLASLASIVELDLLGKSRHIELLSCTYGFLCHPSSWMRQGAASLIATIARHMSSNDVWCLIYPVIRPVLQSEIEAITEQDILDAAMPPLARPLLDGARTWAQASGPKSWWFRSEASEKRKDPLKAFNLNFKPPAQLPKDLPEADAKHLASLRQRGLTSEDEVKLLLLKDHIAMQAAIANRRQLDVSSSRSVTSGLVGTQISLTDLQVVPQTVFVSKLAQGDDLRTRRSRRSGEEAQISRRTSFLTAGSGRHSRLRMHSTDLGSATHQDPMAELRRKLTSLETSDLEIRTPLIATSVDTPINDGTPTATKYDAHPFTPAESVASTPIPGHRHRPPLSKNGKSRASATSDSSKAAPEVSAIKAHAIGHLEMSAELRFPGTASGTSPSQWSGSEAGLDSHSAQRNAPASEPILKTTYEGQDPGILAFIQSTFTPADKETTYDYGPILAVVPERKRHSARKSSTALNSETTPNLAPVLIADLDQHESSIQGIVVSSDHAFFVSVDLSGACLVWDVQRLERTVTTKPRLSYRTDHGRITAVCPFPRSNCFITASEDGTVEISRVWTSRQGDNLRFSRVSCVSRYLVLASSGYPTSLMTIFDGDAADLFVGTSHGTVLRLECKTMLVKATLSVHVTIGPVTSLVVDPEHTWLASATSNGYICVWDLRYNLILRQWHLGSDISTCALHPSRNRKRCIIVASKASANGETSSKILLRTVDLGSGKVLEVFGSSSNSYEKSLPHDVSLSDSPELQASHAIEQIVSGESTTSPSNDGTISATIRCVIPISVAEQAGGGGGHLKLSTVGEGFQEEHDGSGTNAKAISGLIISGSEDHMLRWWNLGKTTESTVISGLGKGGERSYSVHRYIASNSTTFIERVIDDSRRTRSRSQTIDDDTAAAATALRQPLKPHLNAITSIAMLETPFSTASVVVSGDRSGALKVWRLE